MTGDQTCALPIYASGDNLQTTIFAWAEENEDESGSVRHGSGGTVGVLTGLTDLRVACAGWFQGIGVEAGGSGRQLGRGVDRG